VKPQQLLIISLLVIIIGLLGFISFLLGRDSVGANVAQTNTVNIINEDINIRSSESDELIIPDNVTFDNIQSIEVTPIPNTESPSTDIHIEPNSSEAPLTRDINNPTTFRGPVDYAFQRNFESSIDGSLQFIDSTFGMEGIPRYSNDSVRPDSTQASLVLEECGIITWIDFSRISISLESGELLIPESFAHVAALAAITITVSRNNIVSPEQGAQFLGQTLGLEGSNAVRRDFQNYYRDIGVVSAVISSAPEWYIEFLFESDFISHLNFSSYRVEVTGVGSMINDFPWVVAIDETTGFVEAITPGNIGL